MPIVKDFKSLRREPVRNATLAMALAALVSPATAHASALDEDADPVQQITVIGQREPDANPNANPNAPYKIETSADGKFTEKLRDTPKSVTAIPKEVIEDIGATSFRDVARATPGVTLGTGEGGNAFGDRIFIRGFEARNDVYIDGLRDPGVTSREIFAVEQIEIVKGPSGSFGGRGTTGGLVSLQSKKPQFGKDFVVAEAGVGTDAYYRGTLDANYAVNDRFAVRVNGLYHTADTPGRDQVFSDRWGIAAAAAWKATDTLTVSADYYGYRLDGMSDYGMPFDTETQQPFAVNPDNFYGAVGRDFLKNGSDIGTFAVHFEPSDKIALRSVWRYGTTYNHYVVSVPRAPVTTATDPSDWTVSTGTAQRHADNDTFEMLTDATLRFATGGIGHTLVMGTELSRERVLNRRYSFPATVEDANGNIISAPSSFTLNLFNPDPVLGYSIAGELDPTATPSRIKVDTMAFYAIDTVKFSPKWEATLGLRYDMFDIRSTGSGRSGAYDISSSQEFFNGQFSLLYKPVEPVSLYASFSTSSNPSGEQLDSTGADYGGLASGTQDLDPERNKAYEVGAKFEVNKGLLLTAAVFQIDKDNAREQVSPGVFELVGRLRSRGAEVSVAGNITPRWSVFGGYTYLDAKIVASDMAANVGSRFPNVPKYNFSLLSAYRLTNWLRIGGQAYYRGDLYGGTYAATSASVPGYWRFDAVAEAQLGPVDLRLNVLNLTDKRYYDAIYRSSSPFAYIAPGRSATLTAKVAL